MIYFFSLVLLEFVFVLSGNDFTAKLRAQQNSILTPFFTYNPSSTMSQVQPLPTVLPENFNTSDKILEIRSAHSMTLLDCSSSTPLPLLILIPNIVNES